ncbi:MAG TPA: glycosyltransferase [Candidatus Fermentibacter daniensis]|nr:glycosyltransferase [Candidatus Fermentibacter daniensis]HOA05334.1 glycosyltransferase [Candidatus Fermentibacter daniensis]
MTTEILFWTFSGLLLLHYAGYPLALAVISRLAPRRDAQSPRHARAIPVSVLISARNEERHIGARIENLLAQDYDGPVEILVGSDASTDRTDTIVSSFEGVILARSDARAGKPRMLQELRKKATGEVLVFTDADTVFAPGTIAALVGPFADPKIGCVDGVRLNSLDGDTCESAYMKYERFIKTMCSRIGAVLGGTGAVFALRAEAFEPLSEDRADDFELAVMSRMKGYRCVCSPEARAMEPSPDDRAQYRRMVRIVSWMSGSGLRLFLLAIRRGRPGLALQLLIHKILRWLSGYFLVGATVCALLLAGSAAYRVLSIALLSFHLLALAGLLLRDRLPGPARFPFYFWLMNAASMVGFARMAAGRPVETWDRARPRRARTETPS